MKLELYFAAGSCAFASLVALEETGLAYTPHRLDLASGEQKSSAYNAINPRGRVPALVVDGTTVTESIAVLTTIAQLRPEARLLPFGDALAMGKAYELMSWFASGIHVTIAQLWRSERFTEDSSAQQALKDAAPKRLAAAFAELEQRMGEGWLIGNRYTVVDGYAEVFYRWASDRLAMDMGAFPRWQRHHAQMLDRPAVQRALMAERGPAMSKIV